MKKLFLVSITFSLLFLNLAWAKPFGKKDITNFCSNKISPIEGKQFDKKDANKDVLAFVAGKYSYPNGGALLLFSEGYYIMKLPSNRNGIHGTSTDDLMASGGILGGCSKEQLSEAISENALNSTLFKLLKKYR